MFSFLCVSLVEISGFLIHYLLSHFLPPFRSREDTILDLSFIKEEGDLHILGFYD
jgi:hypothetical protein